jgi:hypothetical protein
MMVEKQSKPNLKDSPPARTGSKMAVIPPFRVLAYLLLVSSRFGTEDTIPSL